MLLSLVIPVFNVEDYIDDCLISITKQIINNKNIEVIIIDDGSTDTSAIKIKNYSNIKYFYKKNGGLSSARNYGLNVSSGDYILFVDSDDVLLDNALNDIIKIIKTYDYDLISFDVFRFKVKNKVIKEISCMAENKDELFNTPYYACNKVFKRSLVDDFYPLFPVGEKFEDISTIPLIFKKVDKFYHIPKALYGYRVRPGAITRTINGGGILMLNAITLLYTRSNDISLTKKCLVKESFGILLNILRNSTFTEYSNEFKSVRNLIIERSFNKVDKEIFTKQKTRSKISYFLLRAKYGFILCIPLFYFIRFKNVY